MSSPIIDVLEGFHLSDFVKLSLCTAKLSTRTKFLLGNPVTRLGLDKIVSNDLETCYPSSPEELDRASLQRILECRLILSDLALRKLYV
jgi:hypothetical protein